MELYLCFGIFSLMLGELLGYWLYVLHYKEKPYSMKGRGILLLSLSLLVLPACSSVLFNHAELSQYIKTIIQSILCFGVIGYFLSMHMILKASIEKNQ